MNLNESSLRHPRTQWAIEAAMWRAVALSRGYDKARVSVRSAADKSIMEIFHCRGTAGAFRFFRDGHDFTNQMLAFLRSNR